MIRLSLALTLAGLLLCGCSRLGDAFAQEAPAEQGDAAADALAQPADEGNENIKTPLIRALIQTVNEAKGESPEVKDSLKKALRDADEDLADVLGGNSKRLILQANRKPPIPVIGDPVRRAVKTKVNPTVPAEPVMPAESVEEEPEEVPAATLPGVEPKSPFETESTEEPPTLPGPVPPATEPEAAPQPEEKPPMLEALLKTIDADDVQSPEVKARLREMLRKANEEMDGALSAKKVEVRVAPKAAPSGPVVREVIRGGMKIREFRSPASEK